MTKPDISGQSGFSFVALLVGIAMSVISVAAAGSFFIKNLKLSTAIEGEAEAMSNYSLLLKQTYTGPKTIEDPNGTGAIILDPRGRAWCLDLVGTDFNGFNSNGTSTPVQPSRLQIMSDSGPNQKKKYSVVGLNVVKRSNPMGTDPRRILADLVVTLDLKGYEKSATVDSSGSGSGATKRRTFKVPMLIDLDSSNRPKSCQQPLTTQEMCRVSGGQFNPANSSCQGTH
ncbi:MAG: hypothetical protein H7249_06175 [Chitinophagaceae bacterium]|nr:hypothetical protein [Oligoflexus sp.]